MTSDDLPEAAPSPGVLEAAVYATDLDAAEAFYGGALGLELISRLADRHLFYRVGSSVLLVFNPDETSKPAGGAGRPVPPHGARGEGHVCLAMPGEALDGWRRRLEAAGLEIEADFTWSNGARSIYVRDPAGNSVELAEPRLWAR